VKFLPIYKAGNSGIIRGCSFHLNLAAADWIGVAGAKRAAATSWTTKLALLALAVLLVFTPLAQISELLTAYQTPEFSPTLDHARIARDGDGLGLSGRARLPGRRESVAMLWILMGLAWLLIAPLHFVKVLPEN